MYQDWFSFVFSFCINLVLSIMMKVWFDDDDDDDEDTDDQADASPNMDQHPAIPEASALLRQAHCKDHCVVKPTVQ